uniref:LisH domain-containing protein n=1 Tax=Phytophthora ramorum TaxID=164328 RepID=H3HDG3_PHYRM
MSASSKLDEIITHYFREQHLPPFKLLGKDSLHRCPDPPTTSSSNPSICTRLLRRSRTGSIRRVIRVGGRDVLCDLNDAMRSNDYGAETNCCFSACDGTILTDALDKCCIKFSPSGSVLFAYYPYEGGDYLPIRKSKLKSWFRVLDARDYKDITTIDLGHPVFDLSLNTKSTLLSIVEGRYLEAGDVDDNDSICRLYDVGRKRPAEDDSDAENGEDDSDTLDDDDDEEDEVEDDEEMENEEEETSDSNSENVGSSEEEEEEGEEESSDSDEDAAAHILAVEDDSGGDEDGNGSILSTHDLGYLLDLPDTTYYEVHGQYSSDEDDAEEDE